ncbi:DctP family TRAP transporter solute-binding subunit [Chromohalobacter sp. HP20-39]|uniref:DctP family TRAP transporter solute-binding subunit n=1 Tax=Chromohalobacter sp. HP20-39 TaxID=3079306 RepID=UPI00294B2037|nr:DctP family TRAP transporter solute-binding subunit [Chromohalobacter sp. HP20-39]MDV6317993.1 DctP family TRAP transporter solute-binding subunit [Chromohalobacter sp. HP20-39]
MKFRDGLNIVFASLFMVATTVGVAQAETLRLSSETSDSTSRNKGAERFAKLVEDATGGNTKVKVFGNAVLAGGNQLKQAEMVSRGDIDFLLSSAISVSPLISEMSVFSLPYLYSNYEEVDATLDGKPAEKMEEIMAQQGLVVLGWGESGFRELTNSVHPVKTPDDLNGLKIRVAGPMFIDIMDELGANPQQIQWTETFAALQQGVVDGQENPIGAVIIPQRIYEVQDYLTTWHYSYDPAFLAVSKKLWNSWDKEMQTTMRQAAQQAMSYQKQLTRKQTANGVKFLKEKGMKIYNPSESEMKKFRQATQDSFDKWAKEIGMPLVNTFQNTIEGVRQSQ